ncbi:hypothetical protein [Algoriphagus boritolerans]|uniref:hypothetical protein n=1 Tax=Algoriphagus boritolerans TaxID=308111 RepID=UPI000AE03787
MKNYNLTRRTFIAQTAKAGLTMGIVGASVTELLAKKHKKSCCVFFVNRIWPKSLTVPLFGIGTNY